METIADYPLRPARPVRRPIMRQGWRQVTFIHWAFPPEVVQRNLPDGLQVDTFEDEAYVGLVAFRMEGIRFPATPPIPYLGTFPETNVRTYVRGPDGGVGVWFDSLDITRLLPVAVARTGYRLPYMWSSMSIDWEGERVRYRSARRWPSDPAAVSLVRVRPAGPVEAGHESALERFLTARWGLYSTFGKGLAYAPVDHEPWPLRQAVLLDLEDGLMAAAGYPAPTGDPIVHYSPGVGVRIGLPRRLA